MKLFGFHGPAGSGKDTCGQMLIERGYSRVSFASPIYDMLEAGGFGRPTTQEDKQEIIPWLGVSWRHLAQTLGTEWGRQCVHPELWLEVAARRMRQSQDGMHVVTDVRFNNEAAMIRSLGGVVVHIQDRRAEGTLQHVSEVALPILDGDVILHNDTESLEILGDKLSIALRAWL